MELVAIMDWYSRFVVSWALESSLEDTFVLAAVQEAMEKARPEIAPRPGKSVHQPGFHQVPRGRDVRIGGKQRPGH